MDWLKTRRAMCSGKVCVEKSPGIYSTAIFYLFVAFPPTLSINTFALLLTSFGAVMSFSLAGCCLTEISTTGSFDTRNHWMSISTSMDRHFLGSAMHTFAVIWVVAKESTNTFPSFKKLLTIAAIHATLFCSGHIVGISSEILFFSINSFFSTGASSIMFIAFFLHGCVVTGSPCSLYCICSHTESQTSSYLHNWIACIDTFVWSVFRTVWCWSYTPICRV